MFFFLQCVQDPSSDGGGSTDCGREPGIIDTVRREYSVMLTLVLVDSEQFVVMSCQEQWAAFVSSTSPHFVRPSRPLQTYFHSFSQYNIRPLWITFGHDELQLQILVY